MGCTCAVLPSSTGLWGVYLHRPVRSFVPVVVCMYRCSLLCMCMYLCPLLPRLTFFRNRRLCLGEQLYRPRDTYLIVLEVGVSNMSVVHHSTEFSLGIDLLGIYIFLYFYILDYLSIYPSIYVHGAVLPPSGQIQPSYHSHKLGLDLLPLLPCYPTTSP